MKRIVCLWILFSVVNFGWTQYNPNQTLKGEDVINDFHAMMNGLVTVHPGFDEDRVDSLFLIFQSQLEDSVIYQEATFTTYDFYRLMAQYVDAMQFGAHTSVDLPAEYYEHFWKSTPIFPITIKLMGTKGYLYRNLSNNLDVNTGAEIISINDVPMPVIVRDLLPLRTSDGDNQTFKYHQLSDKFEFYLPHYFNFPDTFHLKCFDYLRSKDVQYTIPAMPADSTKKYYQQRYVINNKIPKQPLHFEIKEQYGIPIGVIRISSLLNSNLKAHKLKMDRFLKETFATIKAKKLNYLILDLRNNKGGQIENGAKLLRYFQDQPFQFLKEHLMYQQPPDKTLQERYANPEVFAANKGLYKKWKHAECVQCPIPTATHQPAPNNFNGELFVMVNGKTFSAASSVAAYLHSHYKTVYFIGEETAGGYQSYTAGTQAKLILPATRLQVNIPMSHYTYATNPPPYPGKGVIPSYYIMPSVKDMMHNIDTEMNYTLKVIGKKFK